MLVHSPNGHPTRSRRFEVEFQIIGFLSGVQSGLRGSDRMVLYAQSDWLRHLSPVVCFLCAFDVVILRRLVPRFLFLSHKRNS